jgi:hypothetical protein
LENNFFWVGSVRIRRGKILVKFGGVLQWPVSKQPGIESITDNFQEPGTRVAAAETVKESESAEVCFPGYVLIILLIARQPAREVVGGINMRQHVPLKIRRLVVLEH